MDYTLASRDTCRAFIEDALGVTLLPDDFDRAIPHIYVAALPAKVAMTRARRRLATQDELSSLEKTRLVAMVNQFRRATEACLYVGKTNGTRRSQYLGSGKAWTAALTKYGRDTVEMFALVATADAAAEHSTAEQKYLDLIHSGEWPRELFYNLDNRSGGGGWKAIVGGRLGGLKTNASMTPEQHRERSRLGGLKTNASMTPEQHRERSRLGGLKTNASMTPEQRKENSRRANAAAPERQVASGRASGRAAVERGDTLYNGLARAWRSFFPDRPVPPKADTLAWGERCNQYAAELGRKGFARDKFGNSKAAAEQRRAIATKAAVELGLLPAAEAA